MNTLYFKTSDMNLRDDIVNRAFEMIKSSSYAEAYELRDIVVCKFNGKGKDDYGFEISVDDCVGASFCITHYMLGDGDDIVVIESELFEDPLKVPQTADIRLDWKEDCPNRYKTVKLHFDEIKEMVQQGISPEEIAETFKVTWSNEDSLWIQTKDNF